MAYPVHTAHREASRSCGPMWPREVQEESMVAVARSTACAGALIESLLAGLLFSCSFIRLKAREETNRSPESAVVVDRGEEEGG